MFVNKSFYFSSLNKSVLAAIIAGSAILGCSDKKTSLYNPNYEFAVVSPVLNSIEPAAGYLAGVESITLNGANFNPASGKTKVFFNGKLGTILNATTSRLEVTSNPGATGDSVSVRILVEGAENFNDLFYYKLSSAYTPVTTFQAGDVVTASTADNNGNVYFHLRRNGVDAGIQKLDLATDEMIEVIPPGNITTFNDLKIAPDGNYVGVQNKKGALFVWTPGTSTKWAASYVIGSASSIVIDEFTFDDKGYIWTVGKNPAIARFKYGTPTDKKFFTEFGTTNSLSAIGFRNGILYVAGNFDGEVQVYQFDIDSNDDLINGRSLYKVSSFTQQNITQINALAIANDGTVYAAIDSKTDIITEGDKTTYITKNGILKISSDGSDAEYLYTGVIPGNIAYMFWSDNEMLNIVPLKGSVTEGENENIYQDQFLYGLNMLNKRRTPYYGY